MGLRLEDYFPETTLANADLVKLFPEWTEEKILSKTGIGSRYVTSDKEDALDLAERVCLKLFEGGG